MGEAVRRAPEAAAALFTAVAGLREPGGDLRRRTTELRQAVAGLVEVVDGVDRGDATAALMAVAADPEATDALRRGRLADVPAGGGFGGLAFGADPVATTPGRSADDPAPPEALGTDGPGADAEAAAATAERERLAAEARAERLAALQAALTEAAAHEAAAAARLDAARAAVEEANAELERATTALDQARAVASDAAATLEAAALPEH